MSKFRLATAVVMASCLILGAMGTAAAANPQNPMTGLIDVLTTGSAGGPEVVKQTPKSGSSSSGSSDGGSSFSGGITIG